MGEQLSHNNIDPRIQQALSLIQQLAENGDNTKRVDVAAVVDGLHAVNKELIIESENRIRVNNLMDLLLRYTVMDFSQKAPLSDKGDELDALAAGLNSLIEEIQYSSQVINDKIHQLNEAQRLTHIGSWELHVPSNTVEWSDELYRIYGLAPQEFEATYEIFLQYIHPDDLPHVKTVFEKAYQDHQPFVFEHRIIRDGETRILDCTGFVTTDEHGELLRITGTAQDITDRRKIEEAKLTADQEKQMAMDALRYKQQFLSNMSHEIRTPLTAIIGFTKVVLKSELNEKQREYINAIKISSDALLVLVNDILDLAKVNAGKMTFDEIPFNLDATIRNMLLLFDTKIQQKNLTLDYQFDENIPEILVGDPVRLNQIILNLVSNAVKFTSQGAVGVSVRLITDEEQQVKISFTVSDSGIGIEPENMERIFDTFQQASSETSRIFGGTGLGLAIVKQLVEAQGGHIHVKSELGVGSTFNFQIAFKKATENERPLLVSEEEEKYQQEKEIHILVAEDVALNQLLMKVVLSNLGFKPHIAGNGMEAIEMLKENTYDIILMDLHMPYIDGFQATEIIRNEMGMDTPIIALTADVTSADIQKSKTLGMNDYATKPIDQKKLYAKIMNVLKGNKVI